MDENGVLGVAVYQSPPKSDFLTLMLPPRRVWPIDQAWTSLASRQVFWPSVGDSWRVWAAPADIRADLPIVVAEGFRLRTIYRGEQQTGPSTIAHVHATVTGSDWYSVEPDATTTDAAPVRSASDRPFMLRRVEDPADATARRLIEIISEMSAQAEARADREASEREELWEGVERKDPVKPEGQIRRELDAARQALASDDVAEARRRAAIAAGVYYLYENRLSDTGRTYFDQKLKDLRQAIDRHDR